MITDTCMTCVAFLHVICVTLFQDNMFVASIRDKCVR